MAVRRTSTTSASSTNLAPDAPDGEQLDPDRLEMPGQPYALALWNLIIRPPRRRYDLARLGPKEFRLWRCGVERVDVDITNSRQQRIRCSHFLPVTYSTAEGRPVDNEPRPAVIYLHQNASCRLEALNLVPLFLPLGISLFTFDFAGCGESDGEYISLGWFERDDLAECVEYLRKTGKVSVIGLWGRSMGAVTALLHADRDHTIAGMVLDSPFCNLRQLATELAQSEYLTVKVPTWLLSAALALGRIRIKSLCGFDIDALAPERHGDTSFVPALFQHGKADDFIGPHHTQTLYEAYTGDKELEMVEGDHNSARGSAVNRKAVLFFCRAFRCSPVPMQGDGELDFSDLLNPDADSAQARGTMFSREARRLLDSIGGSLAERQHSFMPCRVEGALQLNAPGAEAGFSLCLCPLPSEWGGMSRPPLVLFVYVTSKGLFVATANGIGTKVVAQAAGTIDLGVPVLCLLELQPAGPPRLKLTLGVGGPELEHELGEDCDLKVFVWPTTRRGDAMFFDCAIYDLQAGQELEEGTRQERPTREGGTAEAAEPLAPVSTGVPADARGASSAGATDTDAQGTARRQEEASSGDVCSLQ